MTNFVNQVYSEILAAIENGYPLTNWTVNEIVADISAYCPGLENADDTQLRSAVEASLKQLAHGKATFDEWLDSRQERAEYEAASDEDETKQYFRDMYEEYKASDEE